MALTAVKSQRLQDAGLTELFEEERGLWEEIARRAYDYTAETLQPTGERVRPDDVLPALVPALEISDELRAFLARRRHTQKYWFTYFAEFITDRFWDDLTARGEILGEPRQGYQPPPPSDRLEQRMSVDVRRYAVSDFVDDYLGSEPGINLVGAGPAAGEVAQWTQSETRASPLIATVLWRAFLDGNGLEELRIEYSDQLPEELGAVKEMFVIRHPLRGGEPRHDLLVLVSNEVDPRGVYFHPPSHLLEQGWERIREELEEESATASPLGVFAPSPAALIEAAQAQQFGVLVARTPEMIPSSVPSPAVDVRCPSESENFSSVGLLVELADDGTVGVTVALHSIEAAGRVQLGTEVSIGGQRGTVRSVDPITDSCFVALGDVSAIPTAPINGVLSGVTPRNYTEARFEGRGSGPQPTFVTGWSPEIPLVRRRMQLRVLTEPDTVPGDSGAALIDSDGFVLGFAFERTGYNERPAFASWIWADSVLRAHSLRLPQRS